MRRYLVLLLALLALLAPLAAAESAVAQEGTMSLSVHAHTSSLVDTLYETNPLEFDVTQGDRFSYSSIPCSRPAPFNDTSLSFNPDVAGVEDPASTRHLVEGTITSIDERGRTGTVEGTITTTLCVEGEESESQIITAYSGRFVRTSDNDLRIVGGSYEIVGATGVFAGMEGSGRIGGSLTCLPRTLENTGAESCADLGFYADAVLRLRGRYEM